MTDQFMRLYQMAKAGSFDGVKVNEFGVVKRKTSFPIEAFEETIAGLPKGWRIYPRDESMDIDRQHYDAEGAIVDRPRVFEHDAYSIAADGSDVLRAEIDPASEVFYVTTGDRSGNAQQPIDVTDGFLEFVTTVPGTYVFRIQPPDPFQHQTITVTAHAV
jgi:hypothetical protein